MISNRVNLSRLLLVVIVASLPALQQCTQKKSIKGKGIIPREVLVDILVDIHLIDGITNDMKYYRAYNPGDSINMNNAIFKKHEIDSTMFAYTLNEYSKHPDLLNAIYDDVLMELNLLLDRANDEEEEPQKINKAREISKPLERSVKEVK